MHVKYTTKDRKKVQALRKKKIKAASKQFRTFHPQATDAAADINAVVYVTMDTRLEMYGMAGYIEALEEIGASPEFIADVLETMPESHGGFVLPIDQLPTLPLYQEIRDAAIARLTNTGKFVSSNVLEDIYEHIELDHINWRVIRAMIGEALDVGMTEEASSGYIIDNDAPVDIDPADYMPMEIDWIPEQRH